MVRKLKIVGSVKNKMELRKYTIRNLVLIGVVYAWIFAFGLYSGRVELAYVIGLFMLMIGIPIVNRDLIKKEKKTKGSKR